MEAIFVFVGPWVLESSHGTLSRGPICGGDGDDAVSISEGLVTEMIKLGAVAGARKQFNALGPLACDHSDAGVGCSIEQGSSEDDYQ